MGAKVQRVKLIGGTRDGESFDVYSYQKSVYLTKRISTEDAAYLKINGVVCWKSPEEVYERQADGSFLYRETVHYKPEGLTHNVEVHRRAASGPSGGT